MSDPKPSPSPTAPSPTSTSNAPANQPSTQPTPSPQAQYPPIPPLPDVPSNTYQLLLNLASAIDTAVGSFTTAGGKLGTIHDVSNTAVSDVVANSKGEATIALDDVWTYSQKDFTNAQTPLT